MPGPVNHPDIYQSLCDLPENLVGEVLNGELHTHPRPVPKHVRAYSALGGNLGGPFDWGSGPGGWWILDEPELHLNTDIIVPDIAGWRRERMPKLPDIAWFEIPPDWVCEILSPSTARTDRIIKMPIYAREKVAHLWQIDPDLKLLEIYKLGTDQHWSLLTTLKDNDPVRQPFNVVYQSLASFTRS